MKTNLISRRSFLSVVGAVGAAVVVDDKVFVIKAVRPFVIGCARYINLFENKGVAWSVDR